MKVYFPFRITPEKLEALKSLALKLKISTGELIRRFIDEGLNQDKYIKFWLAFIVASMVIALMGCAPLAETVYYEQEPCYMLFEENDTVINHIDTMYYFLKWK